MKGSARPGAQVLARNAALNAIGQALPLLLAVPILPYILHTLGTERFGVLALAWTVIGYFGFLDLGLGRAATRFVAGLLGEGRRDEVGRVVWSALVVQALLGVAGAIGIAALARVLAQDVLRIADTTLLAETERALVFVAVGLPIVLVSGTISGILEAHQRFDLVNLVRVPVSAATLAVPATGALLGWSLPGMVLGIVGARALGLLCFTALATRFTSGFRPVPPHGPTLRELLAFGGWLTVSLCAVPVLTYAERLLLGALRSLTELAYYAVPFEIVARTAVLPAAFALTLFPAFSHAQRSGGRIDELFQRPLRLLFLLQWPVFVVLWLFPREILTAWVNAEVATAAAHAMRLLALALFFNGFAQIALAGVQGLGRPDLKAKLDLVQVPLYLAAAALLIARFGVTGAAAAKLLFTLLDAVLLFAFARRLGAAPAIERARLRRHIVATSTAVALVALTGFAFLAPFAVRLVIACLAILGVGTVFWKNALGPDDRATMIGLVTSARRVPLPTLRSRLP